MKRMLTIAGSLIGLLALIGVAVALALTLSRQTTSPEPTTTLAAWRVAAPTQSDQDFDSPLPSPTDGRKVSSPTETTTPGPGFDSPVQTPTRPPTPTIPPTVTPAPKPTWMPSPIPTITPVPTTLPVPPSAFYALWVESFPEGQGSALWITDPRDIGNRQEVLRFEQDAISEAVLSPDGQKLALVTTYWKTSTLWVANADGANLRQLDQSIPLGIRRLYWSRDSRSLAYNGVLPGEATILDKAGTPVVEPTLQETVELLDLTTGQKQHLVKANPHEALSVLGWSTDGRELYYLRSMPQYELLALVPSSRESRAIASLGSEPLLPLLSPSGSKFLVSIPEGLFWVSADGRTRQDIVTPPLRQWCGFVWSPNTDEMVFCEVDEQRPIEHLKVLSLWNGATRVQASVEVSSRGLPFSPLAFSPDMQWMAAFVYQAGMYWINLSTGMTVPVPSQDRRVIFVAWVPREVTER